MRVLFKGKFITLKQQMKYGERRMQTRKGQKCKN